LTRAGLNINQDGQRRSAMTLLAYPDIDLIRLAALWPALGQLDPAIGAQLEIDGRYAGYLDRQAADIRALRKDEALALPVDVNYDVIGGLSTELRDKLKRTRPESLAVAGRIPGMTPAALTALLGHVKRRKLAKSA
jgi:tRNA uridine 5-carboxymethylaminomethyl modification enzyme